jgi:uncharacterized SAM-binding protein YcdF (DUF218 family)
MNKKSFLWGLVNRRERLGLSPRGWGVLLLLLAGGLWFAIHHIQPFLAGSHRVNSRVLVMEGWVQDFAARAAAQEFAQTVAPAIYTTGGPIIGTDGRTNDLNTYANIGAIALQKAGLPASAVQMVPSHESGRDRTYSSALALRAWFKTVGIKVGSFNVITEDAHARRTWLLFQKAFGPEVSVGVIAIPDPDYDPAHWWRYSEGVRVVLGETIAYVYAAFFFHPAPSPSAAAH